MTIQQQINIKKHHQYSIKPDNNLQGYPEIKRYDFEQPFDFHKFLRSYAHTGFQATHLAEGIEIAKVMQREKATIFLAYTSNQVSSGNRELIKYLVKHKKVDVLVTSAGGIEEDIIKALRPFVLGTFNAPGGMLFKKGITRPGNIFIPNDRYAYFDTLMQGFFKMIYDIKKIWSPKDLIKELGKEINDQSSILYWAAKNDIPIFCPGIVDGSLGDLVVFFKQSHPDFLIDVSQEVVDITTITLNAKLTGGIILGGGISKHFALNANIFREGFDYVVYINTAEEYDGSDSGAKIEEAISWGKVKAKAPAVKVHCDATIAFPLLVAGAFMEGEKK